MLSTVLLIGAQEPLNVRTSAALDPETAAFFASRFAADRPELEQLTGRTFDWV